MSVCARNLKNRRVTAQPCSRCGRIHGSDAARAVNRFSGTPMFVAAHAPTAARATRVEAEADECAWWLSRSSRPVVVPASTIPSRPVSVSAVARATEPFPAARMETLARAKAWKDFLAHVAFSLTVWQLDAAVRENCEDVRDWVGGCRDELAAFSTPDVSTSEAVSSTGGAEAS